MGSIPIGIIKVGNKYRLIGKSAAFQAVVMGSNPIICKKRINGWVV